MFIRFRNATLGTRILHPLLCILFSRNKKLPPLNSPPGMRYLVNGPPKSGTHLAKKILGLTGLQQHPFTLAAYHADQAIHTWDARQEKLLGPMIEIGMQPKPIHDLLLRQSLRSIPPANVFNGHCTHTPALVQLLKEEQIRVVSVIRDPRDIVVSLAEYLKKHNHPSYQNLSWNKCLRQAILGYSAVHVTKVAALEERNWGQVWEAFLPWVEEKQVLTLRFEDLIGPEGGGSGKVQLENLEAILAFLDKEALPASEIQKKIFGGTRTFNVGDIGRWKEKFTKDNKALFKQVIGNLLVKLDYEADDDW